MKEILRVYSKSDLEHFMAWCPVSIPSNYCNYFSAYVKWWPGCTTTLIFQINIVFLTPWFRLKKYPCKGQTNGRNPFSTCLHTKPSFLLNAKVNPLFQQLPLAKLHPKKHFSWSMSFPRPPVFLGWKWWWQLPCTEFAPLNGPGSWNFSNFASGFCCWFR